MIDPGDEWDPAIRENLDEANIIIILCSANSLATKYITQHEIPGAMRLHEEKKAVVVPVVLEACQWERTELQKLNALPEKARPLTKCNPRSNGWNLVAEGIAKVCRKLMTQGSKL